MNDKALAIAVADIHLNEWKKYSIDNSRLKNGADIIRVVCNKAHELNVPVLFAGDLIHNHKAASQEVIRVFENQYKKSIDGKVRFIGIDGNHDQSKKNTYKDRNPGYVELFSLNKPSFKCINFDILEHADFIVGGIPYLTHGNGFTKAKKELEARIGITKKTKILLIHTDLPGAKTPEGMELKDYHKINPNLDRYFKKWDWVISGHIHLPQKLTKKVIMLGSPQHQSISDAGTDMGYWIIYKTKIKFIPLNQYPQFIYYDEDEVPKDSINFWLKRPKEQEDVVTEIFSNNMSRKTLAKKYCKATGQNKKSKINYLTSILNSVE